MFGLLHNLYNYVKEKSERKVTLVTLGLDNAGKTTLINTVQGLLDREVSPTFGFNAHSLTEGKYKVEVFDVGGGKNLRRLWKTYLSEVHAVVYVVDASDQERFEESRKSLEETLVQAHLHDKPVLVFANKQDLPTAATAPDVALALGLTTFQQNRFNILGCIAKTPEGQQVDARLREGLKWVISQVNQVFTSLDVRVKQESAVVKEEEARKKKEREEQARKNREERLRRQQEEEQKAVAAQQEQFNALANLPNQIESPNMKLLPPSMATGGVSALSPLGQFSDLQRPDQGQSSVTITIPRPRDSGSSMPLVAALALPPLSMHPSLAAHAPSTARATNEGPPSRRLSEAVAASESTRGGAGPGSSVPEGLPPAAPSTSRPPSAPSTSRPPSISVKSSAVLDGDKDSNSMTRQSNKVKPTTAATASAPTPPTAPRSAPGSAPPSPPHTQQQGRSSNSHMTQGQGL